MHSHFSRMATHAASENRTSPAVNDHLLMLLLTMKTTDAEGNIVRFAGTFPSDDMLVACAVQICTMFFERKFGADFAAIEGNQDRFDRMVVAATLDYKAYANSNWSGDAGRETLLRDFVSYTSAVYNTMPPH